MPEWTSHKDHAPGDQPLRIAPWGAAKGGKTHLGLTFPEPIYCIDFDMGIDPLIAKFPKKDIYTLKVVLGSLSSSSYRQELAEFDAAYASALGELKSAGGGTLVIDTFTQVRQMIDAVKLEEVRERKAKKGAAKAAKKGNYFTDDAEDIEIYPMDYAEANVLTGSYVRRAYMLPNVNLVLVHRASDVWARDSEGKMGPTGAIKLQGWAEIPAAVDATIQMWYDGKGGFFGKIDSCRVKPKMAGQVIPDVDYDTLVALLK